MDKWNQLFIWFRSSYKNHQKKNYYSSLCFIKYPTVHTIGSCLCCFNFLTNNDQIIRCITLSEAAKPIRDERLTRRHCSVMCISLPPVPPRWAAFIGATDVIHKPSAGHIALFCYVPIQLFWQAAIFWWQLWHSRTETNASLALNDAITVIAYGVKSLSAA